MHCQTVTTELLDLHGRSRISLEVDEGIAGEKTRVFWHHWTCL